MKIQKLKLKAYGHFTDKELDLCPNNRLHLVFGPNEAGKSTVLRALSRFFFGFEHQARDGFLHQNKDLAVGAVLQLPNGEILELTRYKRRKNDLVDRSNQAVDPGFMSRIMSGMSSAMFSSLFGISHDRLRAGGEDLLRAGGQLSQTLFSAASGIIHMRKIQEELQSRRDRLFRPRATTSSILQKKSNLSQLIQELRQVSIPPEQWQRIQSALQEKQEQKTETSSRLKNLETRHSKYSRFLKALPCMVKFWDLLNQWEEVKSVPLLDQEFSKRRLNIRTDLEYSIQEKKGLDQELQGLKQDLENIHIHTQLLGLEPRIKSLQKELALITQSREELEQAKTREYDLNRYVQEKCALLGRPFSRHELDQLGLSQKQISNIQRLSRERAALEEQINQAGQSLRDYARHLKNAHNELKSLPFIPQIDHLELTCKRLSPARDLEDKRQELRQQLQNLARDLEARVNSLGLWTGEPRELQSLPLPLPETIKRMEDKLIQTQHDQESAHRELCEVEKRIGSCREQLNRLNHQSLPQPETLHSLRIIRDQGWRLVKRSWLEKDEDSLEIKEFLDLVSARDLASGLEQSIHRVDEATDSMLDKSHELAKFHSLQEEIDSEEKRLTKAKSQYEQAGQEYLKAYQEWIDLWAGVNITPLSPREMQSWLHKVQEISRVYSEKQVLAGILDQTEARINTLYHEGLQTLEYTLYNGPVPADLPALADLLEKIKAEAREARSAHEGWRREAENAKKNLSQASLKFRQARRKLAKWRRLWAETLEPLDINLANDTETIQEEINLRQELFSIWKEVQNLERKKSELEQRLQAFHAKVGELCRKLGRLREQATAEEMLAVLGKELEQEQEKSSRRHRLEEQMHQAETSLEKLKSRIQSRQRELDLLCKEAGTENPDDLPRLEEKSRLKQEIRTELRRQESALQDLAEGQELQSFMSEAGIFQAHELHSRLRELDEEKQELQKEQEIIISEIATLKKDLQALDGTSLAAEIKQQIQEVRAELEQEIREYIQLTLAQTILDSEMERFRASNQGPVLDQASGYLNRITLGSLTAIYADYDEKGDPVLRAKRPDGSGLGVGELSDGARDQLFLALRLGGLHHYLEHNQPFPFTVDDILVHFDDQRAAQTLEVLADLARQTQVIFFTHHRHLTDLAEKTLEQNTLKVHEM